MAPLYATRDSYNYIGKRGVIRKDGYEKASGTGLYTRDITLPGTLYAKEFLSPYAHAKILSLDTSAVEAYPGVRFVLRYDDPWFAENWALRPPYMGWGQQYEDLVGQGCNFAGEPMGFVVVADTEQICDEALRLAEIEWDVLPFYFDGEEALAPGATILEPDVNPDTNLRATLSGGFGGGEIVGDVEAGFAESDKVIEFSYSEEECSPSGAEPLSCTAVWRGEYLEVWAHNQVPMRTQMQLARYFAPHTKIHLHSMYHGGQFGFANWIAGYKNFPMIACLCAKYTGKPVKHVQGADSYYFYRSYEQGKHYFKIGFKNDGTILACQDEAYVAVTEFGAKMMPGTSIPNYHGVTYAPYFNRPPNVCYRHGMRACGMMNMIYGKVAAELGMDPTELAEKNDGGEGEPIEWVDANIKGPQGFPMTDSLAEVIAIGKQKFDWANKYHAPGAKQLPNGRYHGAAFIHSIAWSPDPNQYLSYYQCCINIQRGDGHVRMIGRHGDGGWNHETMVCQVIADELGAKYDDIDFRPFDDTGFDTAAGEGSAGMVRTTPMVVVAAREAKRQLLVNCTSPGSGGATPLFEGLEPDDLDTIESTVFEKANPENVKTFAEVASYNWNQYPAVIAVASRLRHNWDVWEMGRQCTFVEIEVDAETGEIFINNVVDVNDVGKILNPEGIEAQQYGGSYMGLSHNRNEATVYDPATGVKLNANLIDYKWFSFNDINGPFSCNHVEGGLGYAPYGANGCSESLGATNSTILNLALYNAIGKWVYFNPITPDKVLKALGKI